MTDLADVSPGDIITSARQNLINDYIQDGTHRVTTEAVYITQTSVTGRALSITRNLDSTNTDSPVAVIIQDNASDDRYALEIRQDGPNMGLYLNCTQQGEYATVVNATSTYAFFVQNNNSAGFAGYFSNEVPTSNKCYVALARSTGNTLKVYRDLTSNTTNDVVMLIVQDNASDDQDALAIQQDGGGAWISFDGKAVATGKSSANEYIQVKTASGTRYLQLFT